MPFAQFRCFLSLLFILCFSYASFAHGNSRPLRPEVVSTSSADETALPALVENYFGAYAKKDVDALMSLWSAKAPDFASFQKKMRELFAKGEKIEVHHLAIGKPIREGEKMKARAFLEMSMMDAKTGKPASGFGKMNRTLYFVKEAGGWKVWRELATEEEIAAALVAAKSDGERNALLNAEEEFVTPELLQALVTQVTSIRVKGNHAQAMILYTFMQTIAEKIGDKVGMARVLNGIGGIHYAQGDYRGALDYYQKSLTLSESSSDRKGIADSLFNIGLVHRSQGNYDLALEFYRKVLTLAEATENRDSAASVLNGIGIVYRLRGDNRLALEYYQKAFALFEALGDDAGTTGLLNNIGIVYLKQGDEDQALAYYQKSLALAKASKNLVLISYALNNIGNIHRLRGEYDQSLELYQKSLTMKEELGDKAAVARTLNNIGHIYSAEHKYDRALEYHRKSLVIYEALKDKAGLAETLDNIGQVYNMQGDYSVALEWSKRAADLARETGRRDVLWNARTITGKAYQALNQPTQARVAFDEAIATIEILRTQVAGAEQEQEHFFEDKLSPYYAMIELLIAQSNTGEAFDYAERAKARVLLDVLRSGRANITKAMTSEEQAQERSMNSELVSLNTQISRESLRPNPEQTRLADLKAQLQKTRLDYEGFQTSLYAAHSELKIRRGEAKPMSLDEAGALLPDAKSALLEYVVTEEKTFLFVLTKRGTESQKSVEMKVYTLDVKREDLTKRAEGFRQQLAQRDLGFREAARKLYDLLLEPAHEQLQGKTTLIIVPDAALWQLPFQALQPTARNRYLIEDYAISYAPSLTVLREMMKARRKSPNTTTESAATLLAFGNPAPGKQSVEHVQPALMGEELDPLPEAERQVRALGQLYGAAQSRIYVGAEAREERFKSEAGKYRILQLATHGILNDATPMYSHLRLAQGERSEREDGLLEAWELMNLDLKAELVVLSACETARGRVGVGEGVIGLTWALFVAGSPTTIVSHWKVESASTTGLMLEFHRKFKAGISKAQALQQASLKLLQSGQYQHPFYWAGFVLVGDGR